MAFCRQCGTNLLDGAAFCPSCGTKNNEGQENNAQYQYDPRQYQAPNYSRPVNDVEDNKLIAILCYFGLLFLIPYLTKPDSPFVKFHSNQGLVLFLFGLVVGAASEIPILGWLIGLVCGLFTFVLFILGIVNVCNGETKELPLIGSIRILK